MLPKELIELLNAREFIYCGTCDLHGKPFIAPKFFVKVEGNSIYLVDFVFGRIWENLKLNPWISVSLMNYDNLFGYQINGVAELITSGKEYDTITADLREREVSLTAERVIKSIQKGKRHKHFEVAFPSRMVILKVGVQEIVELAPSGSLARQKI